VLFFLVVGSAVSLSHSGDPRELVAEQDVPQLLTGVGLIAVFWWLRILVWRPVLVRPTTAYPNSSILSRGDPIARFGLSEERQEKRIRLADEMSIWAMATWLVIFGFHKFELSVPVQLLVAVAFARLSVALFMRVTAIFRGRSASDSR
jgi:hypothetical protein